MKSEQSSYTFYSRYKKPAFAGSDTTTWVQSIFEAWFRDVIKDGALWFNMPLLTPIGKKNYLCRFTDIYEGPTPEGGFYWRFSANIELWERPLPPVDWGNYPELLIGSDIIDIAINREWPQA